MSVLGKQLGAQASGNAIYARVGGVQTIVQEGFVRVDGAYVSFHKNVIEKLLTSTTNAVMQNLFTIDEWASTTPKLVTIPAGEIIGSNDNTIEALRTGTGGGGLITLNVVGEIQGAGGDASGGVGGDAFKAEQAITLINNGAIRSGGGGGGLGGVGGGGRYNTSSSGVNAQVSRRNYGAYYYGYIGGSGRYGGTSLTIGNTTYSVGAFVHQQTPNEGTIIDYFQRIVTTVTTHYTTGGSGGAGGRGLGYGYDAVEAIGTAGSVGGTNAGAGGTGGLGGTWGTAGATGSTGASGNYTGGSSGSFGGAAGNAILGFGNVALTNNGTIQGIQA